ncbi:hypothetical protein [Humisphaera borealis]|uniref:Uncharacterized protein n=1 Tax=Humisphaera borealis TaxID=2807512 RepID=A0A7M2WQA6_9BACT|nr:hypothetical protein [Humisphaera borealis]QOV87715.1 hypothetical protein IPV69_15635 [Humisphaera borealis]
MTQQLMIRTPANRTGFRVFSSIALAIFTVAAPVMAQVPAEPRTAAISVYPAASPRPALKYRLIPEAVDKVPGDAAPLYLLAAGSWIDGDRNAAEKALTADELAALKLPPAPYKWSNDGSFIGATAMLEVPLDRLESPKLQEVLQTISSIYPMLELAGRRERCEWGIPLREQGFSTLLPHLANMRGMTRVVCVKARWHLSRGEWNEAIAALRTNFALVSALNRDSVLIQQLVAASIGSMTLKVLEEAQSRPGCPNLYWALASLPSPMLDRRASLEMERAATYWSLPEMQKVKDGTFTEADWGTMLKRMNSLMSVVDKEAGSKKNTLGEQLTMFGAAVLIYPTAKQYLVSRGMKADDVERLPKVVALGRYFVESYDEVFDDMVKWSSVPYWQARQNAKAREEVFVRIKNLGPSNPLMMVVPAVSKAMVSLVKLDRQIAAQQTVEALRAYAAANDGKLPATLDALSQTPAPIDPMTGKPFVYRVGDGTAVIESPDAEQPKDALLLKVTVVK